LAPTASHGGPYSIAEGQTAALAGSATDPAAADVLTFVWDLDNDGQFDDGTGQTPTFDATALVAPQTINITLRVTDDDGGSHDVATTVTITPAAPTAEAAGPYSTDEATPVALDGSGSSDPNNNITTYEWDFDNDGQFDDATGVAPNFVPTDDGSFPIALRVTDATGLTSTDTSTVTVSNLDPTGNAAGPYSVDEGGSVSLAASGTDPAGANDPLIYEWDFDGDTNFDDGTGATASFSAAGLDGPTSLTISLRVSDGDGGTHVSTATVNVLNVAPVGDPGSGYTVDEGGSVALAASATDAGTPDTFTFSWDLDNNGSFETAGATPTFDASALDGPLTATVGLQVTDDDGDSHTSTTTIAVNNVAPVANANGPYSITEGSSLVLNGTATDAAASDTLTYSWDLDGDGTFGETGAAALFGNETTQTPTFDATGLVAPQTLTVTLRVTDDDGAVATNDATVNIVAAGAGETVVAINGSGDLVVTDVNGGSSNDQLTLQTSATHVIVTDAALIISTNIAGATGGGTNSVSIPLAAITGSQIIVNTLAGDDQLILDDSLGNFAHDIDYQAGDPTSAPGDSIALNLTPANGTVVLPATSTASIAIPGGVRLDWTSVESHTFSGDTVVPGDALVRGSDLDNRIIISSAGGTQLNVRADGIFHLINVTGKVRVEGGLGADSISVSGNVIGDFELIGGDERDRLVGSVGNDLLDGGDENDLLLGGAGDNTFIGGDGNDQMSGRNGADVMDGGEGNDVLIGGSGDDILRGNAGNDQISGGNGNDVILAGTGNDTVNGQNGNDIISGGAGDDFLQGGGGLDIVIGGDDADTVAGDGSDDLVVSGYSTLDNDESALAAVLAEWTNGAAIDDRITAIGGLASPLSATNVTDDGFADTVLGFSGADWFLVHANDRTDLGSSDRP
jgi:Ca2+-binding RTX toxin-like protein